SPGMLISCYSASGDKEAALRAARSTLARAEGALAKDQNNGSAMGFGMGALAVLGDRDRAKEWIDRALLLNPDNMNARYNFGCAMAQHLGDLEAALALFGPVFAEIPAGFVEHAKIDPDLDCLRGDPRFQAILAAAEARLA